MNSKSLKIFAFLGFLTSVWLTQDFIRFAWVCRNYGERAKSGLLQLQAIEATKAKTLVVLTGDKNRIPRALELLKSDPNSRLFISGVSKKTSLSEMVAIYGSTERGNDSELWNRVLLDSAATSTVENAEETEKLVLSRNLNQIILITSDYHMLRAINIFRKRVNASIIPFAVGSEFTEGPLVKWPAALFKFLFEYWKWVAFRLDIY